VCGRCGDDHAVHATASGPRCLSCRTPVADMPGLHIRQGVKGEQPPYATAWCGRCGARTRAVGLAALADLIVRKWPEHRARCPGRKAAPARAGPAPPTAR